MLGINEDSKESKDKVIKIVEDGMNTLVDSILSGIILFYRKVGETKVTGNQVANLLEALRKEMREKH